MTKSPRPAVQPTVHIVFEDRAQQAVMRKILRSRGIRPGLPYGGNGYGYIEKNISKYNQPSVRMPFFALTDLDNRPICPGRLVENWLGESTPRPHLVFRVAVNEVETWLMADRENFQNYFGIPPGNIPQDVENIPDPKQFFFNIIRRASEKGDIKRDILPTGNARIGPLYNEHLEQFTYRFWNINTASHNSRSLNKTIDRINELKRRLLIEARSA